MVQRPLFRPAVVAAALAAAVAAALPAQDEVRALRIVAVRAQLQAESLATVAHGAIAVGDEQLVECVPDVRRRMAAVGPRSGDGVAERYTSVALLDALIRTDTAVPGDELAPFLHQQVPVLILLSRDPSAHRAGLLRLFEGAGDTFTDVQRTAGNVLVEIRDPAFARAVLLGPRLVWIDVVDPGDADRWTKSGVGWNVIACGPAAVLEGFPPIPRYRLCTRGETGSVTAPGPSAVAYRRDFGAGSGHHSRGYDEYQGCRIRWLAQLLGEPQRERIEAVDRSRVHAWRDLATLRAFEVRVVKESDDAVRALLAAGVAAKLIDVDPAKVPLPPVHFEYFDSRTDPKVPLPPGWSEQRDGVRRR